MSLLQQAATEVAVAAPVLIGLGATVGIVHNGRQPAPENYQTMARARAESRGVVPPMYNRRRVERNRIMGKMAQPR